MAKTFVTKAARDAKIVSEFLTGNFTKVALARIYGVDEKTVRRAIKEAGAKSPAKPAKVDVKASVKAKAKKAAGAKTSAKAPTVSVAVVRQPLTQSDAKVGDRVVISAKGKKQWLLGTDAKGFNPHNVEGVVTSIDGMIYVKWDNGQTNAYYKGNLDVVAPPVQVTAPSTEQNAVRAALEAGKAVEYVMTGDSVMLTLGDDIEIVESTHNNYQAIRTAIFNGDYAEAYKLMNISKAIASYTKGAITVKNGELHYGEMQLKSTLVERILNLMAEGDEAFKSLVNFLERLLNNPSKDSVEQLWGFISHLDVEIDKDGFIIGWKKVNSSNGRLFDCYTGKVPNDVGNIVEMPRYMVNDDKDQTCSQGLHVAAWSYLSHFNGSTILKVKVDPADVVSIPTDYNDSKMRAAKYEVIDTVDSNRQHKDFARAKDVKKLHVKVGQKGALLSTEEI